MKTVDVVLPITPRREDITYAICMSNILSQDGLDVRQHNDVRVLPDLLEHGRVVVILDHTLAERHISHIRQSSSLVIVLTDEPHNQSPLDCAGCITTDAFLLPHRVTQELASRF